MRLRMHRAAFACALAAALPIGGEAAACVLVPDMAVRTELRPFDLAQARRYGNRAMTAARLQHAREELSRGADPALQLAGMLVPNIRPILIKEDGCGPNEEIDHGAGRETPEALLAGTRFAGRSEELELFWREFEGETFGSMCNAEFRGRFAAHLRRRLSAAQVQGAYLFLAARWHGTAWPRPLRRLAAFDGSTRRPPLRWKTEERWQAQEIDRWMRLVPLGRAFRVALDDFWRESEPLLGDSSRACPAAVGAWPAAQARIVGRIESELAAEAARRAQSPR